MLLSDERYYCDFWQFKNKNTDVHLFDTIKQEDNALLYFILFIINYVKNIGIKKFKNKCMYLKNLYCIWLLFIYYAPMNSYFFELTTFQI